MQLTQYADRISGTTTEKVKGDTLTAKIHGTIDGQMIVFEKKYNHSGERIKYEGTIAEDGKSASGSWDRGDLSGNWSISRNDTGTAVSGKWHQEGGSGSWRTVRKTASKPWVPAPAPTTPAEPSQKTTTPSQSEPTSFSVTIQSSPSGASVMIDKKIKRTTPFSITLKRGSHGIALEKEGYKTKWDMIEVDNYGKKEFYFTLEKE